MALRPSLPCSKTATSPDTDQAEEPDWSDLPPEILCLISRKIADISDFVRFRVVCKRWRSAVRASDLTPQLPWIYLNLDRFEGYLQFYSLLTGKTYTVNVLEKKSVIGPAYNYVLCYDIYKKCYLFNPLTKEELSLPSPPSEVLFPNCVPSGPSHPDQSSRFIVISTFVGSGSTPLYFCQPGNQKWTKIRGSASLFRDSIVPGEFKASGFTFYEGRCYATVHETGSTMVIELATNTLIHVVPRPELYLSTFGPVHLVVSFGQILRVHQNGKNSFCIYQLAIGNRDEKQMEPCWIKIDNISNQFLFLHESHGCSFSTEDFPSFVGNSIYFFKGPSYGKRTFQLFRYDIKEREIEVLPGPVNFGYYWFVPCLC
ncbi:hypothetical protein LUZ61_017454 [Rhynchospora tenuis]|uniref:F-box domain-containing protein n=1 Tax=Rhynchospora tenuis TaxID=198213 RepID=A0AAD6EL08_9POAL|nr:hypothetical protein LUZ61_017454 [Rhynchospora tenuis]